MVSAWNKFYAGTVGLFSLGSRQFQQLHFILLHLTELGLGGRRGLHDDEQRDALRAPNDGGGGSSGMGHPQRCRSVCLQYRKAKLLASLRHPLQSPRMRCMFVLRVLGNSSY